MNALGQAATAPPGRPLGGILSIMAAMALLSANDALAKWLSAGYPVPEIIFFRNLFALLPVVCVIAWRRQLATFSTRRLGIHLLRGAAAFGAMVAFFAAISLMPLADATAVAFAAPLFITALSAPILKERVGPRRWMAVVIGFLGVLLIVRPGAAVFQPAALLALTGAFCYAIMVLLSRWLSRTETTIAIMFYSLGVGLLASALPIPFVWVPPVGMDWGLFILLGLIGTAAHFFVITAFRLAEAGTVAPFEYTAMIWAIAFGYLLFDDLPGRWTFAGAAVVIASGLYVLHREVRAGASIDRGRRAGQQPQHIGTGSGQ